MEILRGYVLGPKLQRLPQRFSDEKAMVPKSGRIYGRPFRTERGATQRDPVYPTVFNIVGDAVASYALLEVFGSQEAQHRLVWAEGDHNIVLYAYDGIITGHKHN